MIPKRRTLLIVGTGLGVLAFVVVLVGVTAYVRAVSSWSDDGALAAKVADAVGETVTDVVVQASERIDRELLQDESGKRVMTLEELDRLRDLYARGEHERVRRELNSRYTRQELIEFKRRLERLAAEIERDARTARPRSSDNGRAADQP